MKTEVIAVGTELLLGQILDTNSSWIGEQLALAGIDSHYQTKVGDNFERIEAAFRLALDRSDAVIVCGGLGPTQDDITREVLAAVMGAELILDEQIAERIRSMFASRSRPMPQNNLNQAMVPAGATPIAQQPGTAPGLVAPIRWVPGAGVADSADGDEPDGGGGAEALERVVYVMPGVPYEMREMMNGTVLADLQARAGVTATIESRVLRTWGQSESGLAEMLAGRIEHLDSVGNPTLAFLASGIEGIKVRVTAKGADSAEAWQLIEAEQAELEGLLGDLVFAYDDDNMEMAVLRELSRQGLSLGVAETITGGRMSNRLSSAEAALRAGTAPGGAKLGDPGLAEASSGTSASSRGLGSSADSSSGALGNDSSSGSFATVFAGGVVVRSVELCARLLGEGAAWGATEEMPEAAIGYGMASAAGAQAMARAARHRTGADVGVAVTAFEDPAEATPEHPFGTAFLAVSMAAKEAPPGRDPLDRETTEEVRLPGDRERLADYSAISVLNLLRLMLAGQR